MRRQTDDDARPDLRALLQAVGARRDMEAYETLFRHFAPRVKAYMARTGGGNQIAEELMQETMIAVWNKAAKFDPSKGAASTWIFTIARNLRIDAFRRENRPDFDPNDPSFVPDEMAPADAELDARETSEQLRQAIATLPEEQAALLKLSFFEDQSHRAIATRLNVPLGTVKSRMRLAFDKLRAALARSGEVS
ncbi:RNA polymerase sigma-70 factor (ECF subfamily) [Aminobacter aminovorans]|uniref:Sigma-K factor n=1 Tax=Aminobacter aminovorans TaxID=83263 RepID=A0A381IKK7_AMIAI|nr:sigma-70 family RNA polymerase sigma factor [Aminobacter aminovorans]TCS24946.1 RNA polymerase sigma-70 factor (ECF subfamily) [Aminobacter aminovorans]SUY28652.1 Sigma-K factor [Aminobacter aminovorans]